MTPFEHDTMFHPYPRALTAQRSYPKTAALRLFTWLVIPIMLLVTPTVWSDPMGRFGSLLEAVQTARAPETRGEEVPGNGTPIVSAGDDQNVTEDDVVSLGAAASDRKSTRLNSSHSQQSRMPSSA